MSLRVSWVNIFLILLVAVLFGCQKSPSAAVVVEPEAAVPVPKEVVVTSIPEPAPQPEPAAPVWVPENVLPREKEVITIPATKPPEVTVESCIDACASKCATKADISCSKSSGAECKQNCGDIIDPSACSTACSLRNAGICESKFIEFCSSKCEAQCH